MNDNTASAGAENLPSSQRLFRVSEQFISIQGEGEDIGLPFSFIRFFGCNYYCEWCDTKYAVQHWSSEYYERSPEELLAWVKEQGNSRICLTGGEPLTAPAQLLLRFVQALKENNLYIDVQSNGTIFHTSLAAYIDSWSISPKLGSSKMTERPDILAKYLAAKRSGALTGKIILKFIIKDAADLQLTYVLLESLPEIAALQIPIVLQPEGMAGHDTADYIATLRRLTELTAMGDEAARWRKYQLRILPQLHRIIWGGRKGI